jgi:uncharacterized SAM-binding protein YcdF (DUF218 family)
VPCWPRRRATAGDDALILALRWAAKVVAALVVLVLVVLLFVATRVWWVARQDDRPHSDAIVVLGAAQFDGRPSSVFTARLVHARDLWKDHVAPVVITVGGGRPGDRVTEAEAGKQWLSTHGVPTGDVVDVSTGSDTLTSIKAVSIRMEREHWTSAVVVTDPWHSLRTRTMADDAGIDAVTSPTRQGPAVRTRGVELRYIARETLAYVYYKLFHKSADLAHAHNAV